MSAALAKLERFPFNGDQLDVMPGKGEVHVVIRCVCDALGMSYSRQLKKLKSDPAATVAFKATVAGDGKRRKVACLELRSLPLWLAGIHPSKVKPAAREKLIRYKREAAEVLADHFLGKRGAPGVDTVALVAALDAKIDQVYQGQLEHISAEVRVTVHAAIRPLVNMVTGLALRVQASERGSAMKPSEGEPAPPPRRPDHRKLRTPTAGTIRGRDVANIMRGQKGLWLDRERRLLPVLVDLADEETHEIDDTIAVLMQKAKLSRNTVYRAIDVLIDAGIVVRLKRKHATDPAAYRLQLDALLTWNGKTRPRHWKTESWGS